MVYIAVILAHFFTGLRERFSLADLCFLSLSEVTLLEPCIDAMPFVSSATALCSKANVDNLLPLKNGIASPAGSVRNLSLKDVRIS